jgi:sulfate adenylyltransferase subunit 1 (EFTu-like GTPase family)
VRARATARSRSFETVRYRTVGDMTCTGAVRVDARDARRGRRRDRRHADHRARRDPRRRPRQRGRDGGPQARGLLLSAAITPSTRAALLLRLATAGSVDDGKSTLIGRLLYDSKAIFEDQLERSSGLARARGDDYVDLALLTDGLRAEREQGITIDVAYRYFATPRRKFIIADTPGHVQYTRNMVTGASTADLAIVLVDARKGVLEQTRRHAFIASLLRHPHLVVRQQDGPRRLDEERFDASRRVPRFARQARRPRPHVHPDLGAARRQRRRPLGEHAPWYEGPPLLTTSSTCTSRPTAT